MTLMEMKRIKILLFQAMNEKEQSLVIDYLNDEIIWHEGFADGNVNECTFTVTKDEFINAVIMARETFSKTKEVMFQVAENDIVSTFFKCYGIHTADFMGFQPTGKLVTYNAVYSARFEKDLIVEIWGTCDGHHILKQIGAL